MSMNAFTAEVAAEQRRDLFRRAAVQRIVHEARAPRRHGRASRFTVRVRPIRPGDAALLAAVFDGLSPSSRLSRFLMPKRDLTAAELRYFTDVDHHDHEAVIALTRLRGEPIGVARFIRDCNAPKSAEIAVEVVDEWQNHGVGSMLAARIAERAASENVTHLTALMSVDNRRSYRLLTKVGNVTRITRDGTIVSYRVALPVRATIPRQRRHAPLAPVGRAS